MYRFVAIEGNIGAGKTTLSTALADKLQAILMLEEYAENPFLPKFYKEPAKHAFALELSFMAARYHQINKLVVRQELFTPTVIADYFFLKSLLFASVTLSEDEYTLFKSLFNIIHTNIPSPDILIFLHIPITQLRQQILQRGRPYEMNIQDDYLLKIQEAYFQSFKQITTYPVVIIPQQQPYVEVKVIEEILATPLPPGMHYWK